MARPNGRLKRRRRSFFPPALTMAGWRLRVTWRLLLATGAGIMAAVMLVCAVPLFARVALSAGLRDAISQVGPRADVVVNFVPNYTDPAILRKAQAIADDVLHRNMGTAVTIPPDLLVETGQFSVVTAGNAAASNLHDLALEGLPTSTASQHVTVHSGHLPGPQVANLEIALTTDTARQLNVQVGSKLIIPRITSGGATSPALTVAGIFDVNDPADPYWHGLISFHPQSQGNGTTYVGLTDATALYQASIALFGLANGSADNTGPRITWFYALRADQIDSTHLDGLVNGLNKASDELPSAMINLSGTRYAELYSSALSTLQAYQTILFVAQIPVGILTLQMLALVLYFISMMTDLLVERQGDAIAVLRSRGASRRQIFGALAVQSVGLGVLALVAGPVLALFVARGFAALLLTPEDQPALTTITQNPLGVLLDLRWYAAIATASAIIAMIIGIWRATGQDVLALRREAARVTHRPLWLRLNLDLIFGALAVGGYALYTYVLGSGALDPRTKTLLSPLALIAPFFILLAAVLFALRILPWLLERGARLAARGRGATSMLALAQTARAPKSAIRMTLLLALSIAFTLFTLIFSASQSQRIQVTAAFAVGADYSGGLPTTTTAAADSLADQTAQFQAIPGVQAAALGYRSLAGSGGQDGQSTTIIANQNGQSSSIAVNAVDATTFGATGIWDSSYNAAGLPAIMSDLAAKRSAAIASDTVPAYVDDAAWQSLRLTLGQKFDVAVPGYSDTSMHFVVAGQAHYIPMIYSSPQQNGGFFGSGTVGGLLVDFSTYAAVYQRDLNTPLLPNFAWLRTVGDPAAQAAIRQALNQSPTQLEGLQDRRKMIEAAARNPFQLNLLGVLEVGAITAVLLAIFGNLVSSWLSARRRVGAFAILRALGAAPRQIAGTLFVEQSLIYVAALIIGIGLGLVLSAAVLPAMLFTNLLSGSLDRFFVAQNVPPIQAVIPYGPVALALGIITLVCGLALFLMTQVATSPAIASTLRVNED